MPGSATIKNRNQTWPTTNQVDSLVPGQLEWPTAGDWDAAGGGQYLVESPANHLDTFVTTYLDSNNKLYRITDYQGLRGTYYIPVLGEGGITENTASLRRYQLWEWIGWAPDSHSSAEDIEGCEERNIRFHNQQSLTAAESRLPSARSMYFWDGLDRVDGLPKLTLYYSDGQGKRTTGSGKVGIDFYEMKSTSAAENFISSAGQSEVGGGGGGHRRPHRELNPDGTPIELPRKPEPSVEDTEGPARVRDAYTAVYARTLAWSHLSGFLRHTAGAGTSIYRRQKTGGGQRDGRNFGYVDTEASNTLYELMRPQMLDVVASVFGHEGGINRIGQIGGNPDQMQSRIQANLRTKLKEEGFADAWIDVFFAEEQVHTITPEGFDLYGTDQSRRLIPAGTDEKQIQSMRMSPGDYTTYPWIAPPSPPASRVVVHAPFGYIVPPLSASGPGWGARGGPPNTQTGSDGPQLVQRYPGDYTFAKYTLHTLNPTRRHRDEVFLFDYAPNNISYQGMGAQWVEVPRSGDLPIVEFSSWALMKVSMDFLIANTVISSKGHVHPDGLVTGIYEKIEILRRMAQRPYPISVFGLDQLLRISMRRAEVLGKPLEFVISDLNVSSMRRSIEGGDKEITTAQIKLTLQEIPIEAIKSVQFGKPNIVIPLAPGDPEGAAAGATVGPSRVALEALDVIGEEDPDVERGQNFPDAANPGQDSDRAVAMSMIVTTDPATGYAQLSPYGGDAPEPTP